MDSNTNLFSDSELKEIFDRDILEILNGQDLPQEKKEELYLKMADTVQDQVLMRIDDLVGDQLREQWISAIDSGDQNKANEFLKSHNIDPAKLIIEEAMVYKLELATLMKLAQNQDPSQITPVNPENNQ